MTTAASRLRRLLREPLLHFLLIGIVVFGAWQLRHGNEPTNPIEIRVGAAELQWLRDTWIGQFGHPPDATEMRSAIRGYVDEEMRYREGLALGLDRDDTIVRRRLAQKYDFTLGVQTADVTPTEAQSRAYFERNPGRYPAPRLTTFCQVYLGATPQAFQAATTRLTALAPAERRNPQAGLGPADDLPFPRCRTRADPADLARDYGDLFAEVVGRRLPPGQWEGPVQSGYGYHLVMVTARTAPARMSFEAARPRLQADWRREQIEAARRREDEALRRRYQIHIDEAALTALMPKAP